MSVPLSLSSVPAVLPYIQYVATNGQTVFPYPFPITQDADLVVVINGVTQPTDSGYTLSGQGNAAGGNLTFTLGRTSGDIITLFRNVTIQRLTQIGQNSGFSSTAFNAEYNNIYLILQQLQNSISLALQIPNTNNPAATTSLVPANYANKYLSFDASGNPTPAALTSSGALTQALVGNVLFPQSAAEATAVIVPSNYAYPPGSPWRYGADGLGGVNDAAALVSAATISATAGVNGLRNGSLGGLYLRTAAETTAAVMPVNFGYPPGHLYRYGTNTTPGTTDLSTALSNALISAPRGSTIIIPAEANGIRINTGVTLPVGAGLWVQGAGSKIIYGGAAGTYLFTVFNNSSSGADPLPVLRGLDMVAAVTGTGNGIKITDSQSALIRQCRFTGFKRGLSLVNTTLWTEQFLLQHVDFWNCLQSIYVDRGGGTGSVATFQLHRATVNDMSGAVALSASFSAATQANPCVVTTSAPHGFESGDVVKITSVTGMTQLNNNRYCIAVTDATHFSLTGVNSSGYGAYVSGGTAAQIAVGMLITTNTSIYRGGVWGLNVFTNVNNSVGIYCDGDWSGARGHMNVENSTGTIVGNVGVCIGVNFSQNPCDLYCDIRGTIANKTYIPPNVLVPGLIVSNLISGTGAVRRAGVITPVRAVYDNDFPISGITQAASAVITISDPGVANPFAVNQVVGITGVVGMTGINGTLATVTAVGGATGQWTITVNINSSGFAAYTSNGIIQGVRYAERLQSGDTFQRLVPAQYPLEVRDPVTPSQFAAERHVTVGTGTIDITASTTPSILGNDCARLNYGGATSITNFTGAFDGQFLDLMSVNTNPTLVHNDAVGGIVIKAGANFTFAAHGTKRLRFIIDRWFEF